MNMRILSPETWNFRNGSHYYGGLRIQNEELGNKSVEINPQIADVACFNYCLADSIITVDHHWGSEEDVSRALNDGVAAISGYAEQMFQTIQQLHSIEFSHPIAVFKKIADELKLPVRVSEKIQQYYDREGGNSLYDVVAAVTWGTQRYTEGKSPRWDTRDAIEQDIYKWALGLQDAVLDGTDPDSYVNSIQLVAKSKVIDIIQHDPTNATDRILALEADGYN